MPEFAIQTHALTRDFGAVRAVDHLTLDVPAGIIFGYLGPGGHGRFLFYPPDVAALGVILSLLASGLSTTAGVLISLRAFSAQNLSWIS